MTLDNSEKALHPNPLRGLTRHNSLQDLTSCKVSTKLPPPTSQTASTLKRSLSLNPFSTKSKVLGSAALKSNPFDTLVKGSAAPAEAEAGKQLLPTSLFGSRKRVRLQDKDTQDSCYSNDKENIPPAEDEGLKSSAKAKPVDPESDRDEEPTANESVTVVDAGLAHKLKPNDSCYSSLPMDWSIKRAFTLSSQCSFDWATKQTDSTAESPSFASCLYSWVAYGTPMPPSHVAIVARVLAREGKGRTAASYHVALSEQETTELAYFKEREEQWYLLPA
ncbi:hypothetical protein HDU91_005974 [Kappamyces sp. JEL0680]|nr:hypothetical protein HDU91_005974 [Kappamyces sp. JEL0680]